MNPRIVAKTLPAAGGCKVFLLTAWIQLPGGHSVKARLCVYIEGGSRVDSGLDAFG